MPQNICPFAEEQKRPLEMEVHLTIHVHCPYCSIPASQPASLQMSTLTPWLFMFLSVKDISFLWCGWLRQHAKATGTRRYCYCYLSPRGSTIKEIKKKAELACFAAQCDGVWADIRSLLLHTKCYALCARVSKSRIFCIVCDGRIIRWRDNGSLALVSLLHLSA